MFVDIRLQMVTWFTIFPTNLFYPLVHAQTRVVGYRIYFRDVGSFSPLGLNDCFIQHTFNKSCMFLLAMN